jgi:hypothetical protein
MVEGTEKRGEREREVQRERREREESRGRERAAARPGSCSLSLSSPPAHRLRRGPDRDGPIQVGRPGLGHPGYLRREALHMVLLRVELGLRNEEREVRVLDAALLDPGVKPGLDTLPHRVSPGAQDVAAGDVIVGDHLRLQEDLLSWGAWREERREEEMMMMRKDGEGW